MEIKEQILALRAAGKRPPYTVKSPSGELMAIADDNLADFFLQQKPLPKDTDLDPIFESATCVKLKPTITVKRRFVPGSSLVDIDGKDIELLRERLRIVTPNRARHCMTWGDHHLEFYQGDRKFASLEMIDFTILRCDSIWVSDASFVDDGLALAEWMASLGNSKPLEDYQKRAAWSAKYESALELWRSAMPECLQPMWGSIKEVDRIYGPCDHLVQPALEMLTSSNLSQVEILRVLLTWLSNVDSPDSTRANFPATVIATFPVDQIAEALRSVDSAVLQGGEVLRKVRPQIGSQLQESEPSGD